MTRRTKRVGNVVEVILERIAAGETLAAICRSDERFPTPSCWYEWVEKDEDLSRRFARAREVGADVIADDALRIADTPQIGVTETDKIDRHGKPYTERQRGDMTDHRKLQIHTRMQLLAKWQPKKYGDRMAVDATMQVSAMSEEQINAAIARLIEDK